MAKENIISSANLNKTLNISNGNAGRKRNSNSELENYFPKNIKLDNDTCDSDKIQCLFHWAMENGATGIDFLYMEYFHSEISNGLERTLRTLSDIHENQVLTIPGEIILSDSIARISPIGKEIVSRLADPSTDSTNAQNSDLIFAITGPRYPLASTLIALAAYLVVQDSMGKDSFWYPYLSTLPIQYPCLPHSWSTENIKRLLGNTNLEKKTIERKEWLERVGAFLKTCSCFLEWDMAKLQERVEWAFGAIFSRAFPRAADHAAAIDPAAILEEADSAISAITGQDYLNVEPPTSLAPKDFVSISNISLYPILDLLDHSPTAQMTWTSTSSSISFALAAKVPAHSQVLNNYGPKGNENLLANYGFVIENNKVDYVRVCLGIQTNDPLLKKRTPLLADKKTHFLLFKDDAYISGEPLDSLFIQGELSETVKICGASEAELRAHEKAFGGVSGNRGLFVGLASLHAMLNHKLKSINTNVEFREQDRQVKALVLTYRNGQVSILKHYIELVEKRMEALRASMGTADTFPGVLNILKEYDEFTVICFGLAEVIHCLKDHEQSEALEKYPEQLVDSLKSLLRVLSSPKDCKSLLGKNQYGEFKDFYCCEIAPVLRNVGFGKEWNKDYFLTAFTFLQLYGFENGGDSFAFIM